MRDIVSPLDGFLSPFGRRAGLASLFSAGQPGHWPDSYNPAQGRLFQDAAGTTPVTAPGQPVGLVLDMSQGGGLGPELVTNGGFDSDTGWTKGTGWTISDGSAFCSTESSSYKTLSQSEAIIAGKIYSVTFQLIAVAEGRYSDRLYISLGGEVNQFSFASLGVAAPGTYTARLQAGATDTLLKFSARYTEALSIDNISVRHVPGNHASQATALSRPTLAVSGGLYHLTNDGGDSLPVTLPAGTYGRASVDSAGVIVVDTVVDPTNALAVQNQRDIILRQGAFTAAEEAQIRAYWARYAA